MNFQNTAFIVGGVFLAMTLLMLFSRVREILPMASAKSGKIAWGVAGVVILGIVVQQAMEGRFDRWFGSTPLPAAAVGQPAPIMQAAPPRPPVHHAGRISAEFATPPAVVEAAPATIVEPLSTEPVESDSAPAPSGGRGKRIVKSVGRFLHIGHKTSPDTP